MNDNTVVDYILDSNIEGAFVECGVQTGKIEKIWINGLKRRNIKSRELDCITHITLIYFYWLNRAIRKRCWNFKWNECSRCISRMEPT